MRTIAAVVACVAALVLAPSPAAGAEPGRLFVVHALPGVAADVYLDGRLAVAGSTAGDVVGPVEVTATARVEVFAAVDDPPTTSDRRSDVAVAGGEVGIAGGQVVSVAAHLDPEGRATLTPFVDDVTPTPPGQGRVTLRHVARVPALDVVVDGATVPGLTAIGPGGQTSIELEVGDYPTAVALAGTVEPLADAPLSVRAGTHDVVYAMGSVDDATFALFVHPVAEDLDTPPEAVHAGDSGLARAEPGPGPGVWVAGLAVVAAGVTVAGAVRRRRAAAA
jgi:hypothetical protein